MRWERGKRSENLEDRRAESPGRRPCFSEELRRRFGDDRIQSMGGGHAQPEAWTHGSSEQRVQWFGRGLEGGDPDGCDSFAAGAP